MGVLLLALVWPATALAQQDKEKWEIGRSDWRPQISAQGTVSSGSWQGPADLRQDLGYSSGKAVPQQLAWTSADGRQRWELERWRGQFAGYGERTEFVLIGGFLPRNVQYRMPTEMQIEMTTLSRTWLTQQGAWTYGVTAAVRQVDIAASGTLTAEANGFSPISQSSSVSWQAWGPLVGGTVERRISPCFRLRGAALGLTNGDWEFWDGRYELVWQPRAATDLAAVVGYRKIHYAGQSGGNGIRNVDIAGWFYGVQGKF